MSQIKVGTVLSYVQMGLSIIITLFYTPVMIRLMGNGEYGLYNTVSSVISIIALLNLGFGSSYIRYYSELNLKNDKTEIYKLNGMFLCIFLFISVVVIFCGVFLVDNLNVIFSDGLTSSEYETARKLFVILIINLAFSLPMNVFTCIVTAHERFVFFKLVSVLKTVASPLLALPLLVLGYRSVGMVIATLAVSLICDIVYLIYVLGVLKERFIFKSFDKAIFKDIFSYTIFIAIHLVVDQINWNVDKILLGRFKGTGDVAIYSVGYSLYIHYMSFGLAFVNLFVPRVHGIVSKYKEDKRNLKDALTELFAKVGKIHYICLAPVAVGFLFWGRTFVGHWVGDEFSVSYVIALLLIIPGSIDIIQNLGIEIQRAQNLHRFRAVVYAIMAIINIIISVILCQKYGAVGCAVGTAISLVVVQGIVINIYYHKKCNIDIFVFWKKILQSNKSLVLPIIFGLICKIIRPQIGLFEMIVQIGLFCAIYVLSLFWFEFNRDEIAYINKKLKKRE